MNGRTSRLPRLVVGISRSPASWWALAWATGEARRRGVRLLLVHVYRPHLVPAQETCQGFGSVPLDPNADLVAAGEGLIWVAIDQAVGQMPHDVDVEQVVIPGRPAVELSCLALGDDMLVLGSRHRGWLRRLAPGSVARACARRAECPVVVVPEPSRAALTATLPVDSVRGRWPRWVPHHAGGGDLGPWRRRRAGGHCKAVGLVCRQPRLWAPGKERLVTRLTVRDVMNPDPVTVTTRTPFKQLVALLAGQGLAGLPVLTRQGEVAGLVTEADLLKKQGLLPVPGAPRPVRRAYRARWSRATGDCAGEVMTTRPLSIRPEATVAEAARLMDRQHCACLPVVDPSGKLAGTITARDLLRVFLRPDSQIRDDVLLEIRAGCFAAAPGSMTADVEDGVVTVSGRVQRKSMLPLALAVIRGIDGVVDVEGQLTYAIDDTRVTAAGDQAPEATEATEAG